MYIVTRYFTDAQDKEYAYHEGDKYPREGLSVSEERINNLMSGNNFQKVSLIKKVDDSTPKVEKKDIKADKKDVIWSAEDIQRMPYMKLKAVAKQNDVEVKDREASEVRADLIEKLGL